MLKADKAALAAALAAVSPAIKAKNTIPVLQNILIAREDGRMIARGGNMDVEMTCAFDAVTTPDFVPFTCPVQGIVEFVKRAPDASITIEGITEAGRLEHINLRSGRSRLKLPILPASDYPKLSAGGITHRVTLDADMLSGALGSVSHAMSSNPASPYLCGALLAGCDEGLNIVATDTYRIERRLLAATSFDREDPFATIPPTIVPSDTINRIIKLASDAEDIEIGFAPERLVATAGGITLISKLIDGTFVDWRMVTEPAQKNSFTARFSKTAMADAVDRVLIASATAKGITFAFEDGAVTLANKDVGMGASGAESEDQIPAEADLTITIGLNGKHLNDALANHDGDQVELLIQKATTNSILRPVGKPDDFTLLVPMKLQGITI